MAYTAHDPRLFYNAIITRLTSQIQIGSPAAAISVGEAEAPDDALDRTPYAVLYQLDEDDNPDVTGDLADPHRGTYFNWQVTSVGKDPDEAQWLQQKVRSALLGFSPSVSGVSCERIERDGGDGVRREDQAQPARFRAVDTFICFTE